MILKGCWYQRGVSPSGKFYYNQFIQILGDKYAPHFLIQLMDYEISNRMYKDICKEQAKDIISLLKSKLTTPRLIEVFKYLEDNFENLPNIMSASKFKEMTKVLAI